MPDRWDAAFRPDCRSALLGTAETITDLGAPVDPPAPPPSLSTTSGTTAPTTSPHSHPPFRRRRRAQRAGGHRERVVALRAWLAEGRVARDTTTIGAALLQASWISGGVIDRKSTRLNSSHLVISYA